MKNKARLAHRDLKPHNIIINTDGDRFLLTDFGSSCQIDDLNDEIKEVFEGSPLYMSPQLYENYQRW